MGGPQGRLLPSRITAAALCLLFASIAHGQSAAQGRSWDLTFRQLEWQDSATREALMWDVIGWVGTDRNRLWIRDEGGRHISGAPRDNRLEVLWGRRLRWRKWMEALQLEMLLGARHDSGTTPTRTYGALGVQGQLPLGIRFEATGYLGDGSRRGDDVHSGVRAQLERDWQLTGRLSLTLRAEHEVWSEDHVRYSEGAGPWMWSAGARLRYAASERVAPYVGVEWFDLVDDTASLAEAAGEESNATRALAGLRIRFR